LTDSAGLYRSPAIPPGVYDVEVVRDEFVPSIAHVTVAEGAPTTTENFVLERTRPFTVAGKVTDSNGKPISQSIITLVENSAIPGILKVQTVSTGRYSITMNPGPYVGDYTISVAKAGYASSSITITIPNGATIVENFSIAAQGSVTGRVTDSNGAPLAAHPSPWNLRKSRPIPPDSIASPRIPAPTRSPQACGGSRTARPR
jgi:protocatechuate 3,4-dioxygenase beta subunit